MKRERPILMTSTGVEMHSATCCANCACGVSVIEGGSWDMSMELVTAVIMVLCSWAESALRSARMPLCLLVFVWRS